MVRILCYCQRNIGHINYGMAAMMMTHIFQTKQNVSVLLEAMWITYMLNSL